MQVFRVLASAEVCVRGVTDQDCEGGRWDPGGVWYCPAGAQLWLSIGWAATCNKNNELEICVNRFLFCYFITTFLFFLKIHKYLNLTQNDFFFLASDLLYG